MKLLLLVALAVFSLTCRAQQKYWIFFRGKPYARMPFTDRPVSARYVQRLGQMHVRVSVRSRWLNGVSAWLTTPQVRDIRRLSFVRGITPISLRTYTASVRNTGPPPMENRAYLACGGEWLAKAGLTGKNVKVGIIDGGFLDADRSPYLAHLFLHGQVKACKDFVTRGNRDFYRNTYALFGLHGTYVWQLIGGASVKGDSVFGAAVDARYYIARTDDDNVESRREEDNWVAALEWMDSLGVKVVNTSLGYSHDFDNPAENYSPRQMNGRTSVVSRAARIAVARKGMIIIAAAGNEGDNKAWRIIETPADVDGVIAVGAIDRDGAKLSFSSEGPDFLQYLKPDLCCYSNIGTSGAAPVVTGLVACLLQKYPKLDSRRVADILRESGSLYPHGDSYLGYGVPDAQRMLKLAAGDGSTRHIRVIATQQDQVQFAIEQPAPRIAVVLHQHDSRMVASQEKRNVSGKSITVRRSGNEKYTTVIIGNQSVDIEWKR